MQQQQSHKQHTPNLKNVDYKDVDTLRRFLSPYGRVLPKRRTGISAKNQRKVARAVKRARHMGLLSYSSR